MRVVNWATPGPYMDLAKTNRELSLKNCPGLDFWTIEIPSVGNWVMNTCRKPEVALQAVRSLPQGEGCLLLDADAHFEREPEWKSLINAFFGYVRWTRPNSGAIIALSGTLWITNTNQCIQFLEGWNARCQLDPTRWDQAHMWECIKENVASPGQGDILELDCRWAWMEGNSIEPRGQAWVAHSQASRELKDATSTEQPDTAPLTPSETDVQTKTRDPQLPHTGGRRKKNKQDAV
jgi:hypothetical protein